VPRGTIVTETSPWVYTRRGDVTAPDLARRRLADASEAAADVRLIESPRARLTREFAPVADHAAAPERAVPRNVRTRPTPGDTVPELRSDPMTTIPFPVARRRPREGEQRGTDEAREPGVARAAPRRWERIAPLAAAPAPAAPAETTHPTDVRTPTRALGIAEPEPRRQAEPRTRGEGDREVLRPLFRPLAHPRSEDRGERAERPRARADGEAERPRPRAEGEAQHPRARPEGAAERPRARPDGDGERPRARPRGEGETAERGGRREAPPPAERAHARRRKEGSEE
jgi:hypothetical protein